MPVANTDNIRGEAVEYVLTNDNLQFSALAEQIQEDIVDHSVGRGSFSWEECLCLAIPHSSDTEALQIKELIDSGQFQK